MFVTFIPSHIAGLIISCTLALMMERAHRLLDIIYASAVAQEIHNLRCENCCGCKIYPQDCLMMTEEGWDMHGLTTMVRVKSHHTVWHEFLEVLEILNMAVNEEFADHLMELQKDPDRYFVRDLMQLHENNQALAKILNDLSHPPAQPLEPDNICYFSYPGSYKYYVKGPAKHFNHARQTIRRHTEST